MSYESGDAAEQVYEGGEEERVRCKLYRSTMPRASGLRQAGGSRRKRGAEPSEGNWPRFYRVLRRGSRVSMGKPLTLRRHQRAHGDDLETCSEECPFF
jgi:hypothetical protein